MKSVFLVLTILLTLTSSVYAEKFTVEAKGYHIMSRNESLDKAEESALKDALRSATEMVAVRVSSYSNVINNVLVEDKIETFASAVVQIKEKSFTPTTENGIIKVQAYVLAIVDTSDLEKWEPPDIAMRKQLEIDKERLRKENIELNKEVTNLKVKNAKISMGTMGKVSENDKAVQAVIKKVTPLINPNNHEKAHKLLIKAVYEDGIDSPELSYLIGMCAYYDRKYASAAMTFGSAYEANPLPKYLKAKADALYMDKKYDLAFIEYNNVLKEEPNYGAALANRGAARWVLGDAGGAFEDYDKAIKVGGAPKAAQIRAMMKKLYDAENSLRKRDDQPILPVMERRVLPLIV